MTSTQKPIYSLHAQVLIIKPGTPHSKRRRSKRDTPPPPHKITRRRDQQHAVPILAVPTPPTVVSRLDKALATMQSPTTPLRTPTTAADYRILHTLPRVPLFPHCTYSCNGGENGHSPRSASSITCTLYLRTVFVKPRDRLQVSIFGSPVHRPRGAPVHVDLVQQLDHLQMAVRRGPVENVSIGRAPFFAIPEQPSHHIRVSVLQRKQTKRRFLCPRMEFRWGRSFSGWSKRRANNRTGWENQTTSEAHAMTATFSVRHLLLPWRIFCWQVEIPVALNDTVRQRHHVVVITVSIAQRKTTLVSRTRQDEPAWKLRE